MAVIHLCDGCKTTTDKKDLAPKGIMGNEYCPECLETIDAFLAERDELHDKVQKQWGKGIDALRKKYHSSLKFEGKLPDEYES